MSGALTIPALAAPFIVAGKKGMTARQIALLHVIAANPGASIGPLADAVGMGKGNVSIACDKLEAMGFAARTPHPQDGRLVQLHATAAGKRAVAAVQS